MTNTDLPSPLALPSHDDETFMSFVSRIAARNGAADLSDFRADIGVAQEDVVRADPEALAALAVGAGIPLKGDIRERVMAHIAPSRRNSEPTVRTSSSGRSSPTIRLRGAAGVRHHDARRRTKGGCHVRRGDRLASCAAHAVSLLFVPMTQASRHRRSPLQSRRVRGRRERPSTLIPSSPRSASHEPRFRPRSHRPNPCEPCARSVAACADAAATPPEARRRRPPTWRQRPRSRTAWASAGAAHRPRRAGWSATIRRRER